MVCACRYFAVVAGQHGVIEELLAYELAFAALGAEEARAFVARTGVPQAVLRDPKARNLEPGSAADQLNEGITAFYMGMKQAGYSDDLCLFARCTIVGYLASHSKFASLGEPLRGLDTFYK